MKHIIIGLFIASVIFLILRITFFHNQSSRFSKLSKGDKIEVVLVGTESETVDVHIMPFQKLLGNVKCIVRYLNNSQTSTRITTIDDISGGLPEIGRISVYPGERKELYRGYLQLRMTLANESATEGEVDGVLLIEILETSYHGPIEITQSKSQPGTIFIH